MKIILGDTNAKVERKEIYFQKIDEESLHDYSNDDRIRLINFGISKNVKISLLNIEI